MAPPSALAAAQNAHARTLLPRPIINPNRTYFDKLLDFIVGEGPNNRFVIFNFGEIFISFKVLGNFYSSADLHSKWTLLNRYFIVIVNRRTLGFWFGFWLFLSVFRGDLGLFYEFYCFLRVLILCIGIICIKIT